MKRLIPLLLVSILAFSCGKEQKYKIGVSQCSQDDWRMLMNEQMEREMMFHPEATLEIRSADDSNEKQISDIKYFIEKDFDIIIAAPNEADPLTPVITEAYNKGIPVLIFDRNIHGDRYTAFQGADNAGIGYEAAVYASGLLPEGGTVIELQGLPASTPAEERKRGFHKATDSIGNLRIVASVAANWKYVDAVAATDSLLSLYPDVSLIYAHNDRMALGASDVAAKKGLHPYIIGIDAAPEIGIKAVKEGKIDATFIYPSEGDRLINTALAILEGEEYDKDLRLPVSPAIDKKNVDLLIQQISLNDNETRQLKELKTEVDAYWNEHNSQTMLLYSSIAILVLVCILLFLVLRTYWTSRRHHAQLLEKNRELQEQRDLEKELNSQLAAATQSKLLFFTNVSHDLRTPITLISEPVEQVAQASNLTDRQRVLMNIADKNVKILKRLINQILDFRKFEHDKLEASLEEVSPALYGREWAEAFNVLAAKKHIDYKIDIGLPEGFTMAFDIDKIERVIFNILSNAFKYTPVKGKISFSMGLMKNKDKGADELSVIITDSGRGISADNLKHIFARFYQVDKIRPEGSGIGLSLAKAFVELHKGTIDVESEEAKGTRFVVKLPVVHVENAVSPDQLMVSRQSAREVAHLLDNTEDYLPEISDASDSRPVLLIIDDNEDIRRLVGELLREDYQIISASDGRQGIKLATRYVPDVIVCDVMMPGIDGMETCAAIKREISTSHIPVLMLTACSLDEQRVESYESGADAYMSKPFNGKVLKARIESLLANRKRIKEVHGSAYAAKPTMNGDVDTEGAGRKDVENEFYNRFVGLVKEEMGNIDLSIDALAEKMGMGRSQFYRKIKAITNLSPVEILRDMRLKKARKLLLTTEKTISEIAYEVGFSTPAYFTKCYREVYSETPTSLRERIRGSEVINS